MKRHIILILAVLTFAGINYGQGTTKPTATSEAATTSAKPKKPSFRATKDQITMVQTKLKEAKLYAGEITGKGNPEFKTAVKSWQKDNGLKANGSLNRATLEKMGIELTEKQMLIPVNPSSYAKPKEPKLATSKSLLDTPQKLPKASSKPIVGDLPKTESESPKRPAPFTANKDQIMALQKSLKDAKMFSGDANGERSDDLKDAVKKYQEANTLKVTGGINAAVLEKAGIALTDKQKAQVVAQAAYDAAKLKN